MANRLHCALHSTRLSERGQILLTILLVIGAGVAALVYTLVTPANQSIANDKKTAAALAQAKAALIGYAASNTNQPGILPCPDSNNDGSANSPCGATGVTAIGRLPWKTLGLPDLRDGAGECLWYAVSANFKNSGTSGPSTLNSDSAGTLVINDTSGAPVYSGSNAVLAIVFAPGGTLSGQDRSSGPTTVCGGNTTVANYLEGGNQNGAATNTFVSDQATTAFNDRLLAITSDALFSVVAMRVAREVRTFLTTYFNANGYYPFANSYTDNTYNCTPLLTSGRIPNPSALPNISVACPGLADWLLGGSQPPAWFAANNWHLVTHYAVAPACTSPLSLGNCLGVGGLLTAQNTPAPNNDKRAIVIVTGRGLSGQSRPCASVADCLEDPENTNGDTVFIKPVLSPTDNDRLVVVSP